MTGPANPHDAARDLPGANAGASDNANTTAIDTDDDATGVVCSNGVNPRTGHYAVAAPTPAELCALAEARPLSKEELAAILDAKQRGLKTLGVGYGVDANALDESGWGLVFAANDPDVDAKKARLKSLIDKRMAEAGALYREFSGADGLQPDETGRAFLARFGDAEGPVAVEKVPYYLLIVASPALVPFAVQTELDSRHAVGRLDFDTLDELAAYAAAVVARETASEPAGAKAVFFATANPGDLNTSRSLKRLATPLADTLERKRDAWTVERYFRESATKDTLATVLSGAPSLLITASHGLALDSTDATQRERQGALVTQQWPGPLTTDREMTSAEYFAGNDVPADAALGGMIALLFACFGGGTPPYDEFLALEDRTLRTLTPTPFVARLPERLLLAGAGAVIGHVERAWSCSFLRTGAGTQIKAFEETMLKLVDGWRVGAAVDALNVKCNEIADSLANALRRRKFGMQNDEEVADLVLTRTDAANFIIVGDPAVRLNVAPKASTNFATKSVKKVGGVS